MKKIIQSNTSQKLCVLLHWSGQEIYPWSHNASLQWRLFIMSNQFTRALTRSRKTNCKYMQVLQSFTKLSYQKAYLHIDMTLVSRSLYRKITDLFPIPIEQKRSPSFLYLRMYSWSRLKFFAKAISVLASFTRENCNLFPFSLPLFLRKHCIAPSLSPCRVHPNSNIQTLLLGTSETNSKTCTQITTPTIRNCEHWPSHRVSYRFTW